MPAFFSARSSFSDFAGFFDVWLWDDSSVMAPSGGGATPPWRRAAPSQGRTARVAGGGPGDDMITPVEPVLPDGLDAWCVDALGSAPVEVLSVSLRVSRVFAVRLADGREAVVKARDHPLARAATCVAVQGRLADAGFPVARPLTPVSACRGHAVHVEAHRPGGEVVTDDGPDAAASSGRLFARAATLLRREAVAAPTTPEWLAWDHDGPGPWPPSAMFDRQQESVGLPSWLVDLAGRARRRLARAPLPAVLGHGD